MKKINYILGFIMLTFTYNAIGQSITCSIANPNLCVTLPTPVQVNYTKTGVFNAGNIFTAQLSNPSGSFATVTNIGNINSTNSGFINATIPANVPSGTAYRIRVVGSNPSITGTDNGSNITICNTPVINSFSPTSAGTGSTVIITGNNFTSATAVSFGGIAASSFTIFNTTTIIATVGSGASGNVSVTTGGGVATLGGFCFPVTIPLTSGPGTINQALCVNTAISTITYAVNGATGAGATGLPPGVSGIYSLGVFTISGTPTSGGIYNYTVTTTGGGCSPATANGTITVYAPVVTVAKTPISACNISPDGTITVTTTGGSGSYIYSWTGTTGPNLTPFTAGNVSSLTGLNYGYYNVLVADAGGCGVVVTNNIHVDFAYYVYITNNGSVSSSCGNTGSIILYGNAGIQPYTYSLDGTNYQASNTFTDLAAGVYTAYVKDAAGCFSSKIITVGTAAPIVVSPFVRGASSCAADGSIEIYRSGGIPPYTYSLDNITYGNVNIFSNLAAGPYTAYVKDSKGCIGSQAVNVAQGAALVVTATKTNTSTCVNDGTIQLFVSGGVSPFTYSKDNGATYQPLNSFTGLPVGNYQMKVKDFKNCLGNLNVVIGLNPINVTSYVTNAPSCAGNGTIKLYLTGGVGPYTYSLDGNTYQSSNSFPSIAFPTVPPGTYDGYVKDSKACIGFQSGIVVGPACPRPLAGKNNTSISVDKILGNNLFKVQAFPNPTNSGFTLQMSGINGDKVSITVTDILGRKVYQIEGNGKQQYKFGDNFKAGIYLLQVSQGTYNESIKLIRE
jgi:hypothetical protein